MQEVWRRFLLKQEPGNYMVLQRKNKTASTDSIKYRKQTYMERNYSEHTWELQPNTIVCLMHPSNLTYTTNHSASMFIRTNIWLKKITVDWVCPSIIKVKFFFFFPLLQRPIHSYTYYGEPSRNLLEDELLFFFSSFVFSKRLEIQDWRCRENICA